MYVSASRITVTPDGAAAFLPEYEKTIAEYSG
jgi:hypothetical protein